MKKTIISAIFIFSYGVASGQDATKKFALKLTGSGNGVWSLTDEKKDAAILDLSQIPDLLVPYEYVPDKILKGDYWGVDTREFVYKRHDGY